MLLRITFFVHLASGSRRKPIDQKSFFVVSFQRNSAVCGFQCHWTLNCKFTSNRSNSNILTSIPHTHHYANHSINCASSPGRGITKFSSMSPVWVTALGFSYTQLLFTQVQHVSCPVDQGLRGQWCAPRGEALSDIFFWPAKTTLR